MWPFIWFSSSTIEPLARGLRFGIWASAGPSAELVPDELIVNCGYTLSTGCDITRLLGVLGGLHDAAQQDHAVITIDHNRNIARDPVVGQRTLDLGYQ